jgi:hypothetical protein
MVADHEAGGRVGELARVYGIHRTTVSAHVARAGKTRGQLTEAQVDEAVRLYEQGWSLRAVGRHLGVADKTIRRMLDSRAVAVRPVGRLAAGHAGVVTRLSSAKGRRCRSCLSYDLGAARCSHFGIQTSVSGASVRLASR